VNVAAAYAASCDAQEHFAGARDRCRKVGNFELLVLGEQQSFHLEFFTSEAKAQQTVLYHQRCALKPTQQKTRPR
jgi:hypothetical protein